MELMGILTQRLQFLNLGILEPMGTLATLALAAYQTLASIYMPVHRTSSRTLANSEAPDPRLLPRT